MYTVSPANGIVCHLSNGDVAIAYIEVPCSRAAKQNSFDRFDKASHFDESIQESNIFKSGYDRHKIDWSQQFALFVLETSNLRRVSKHSWIHFTV